MLSYEEWVREEARKVNSDGCTAVSEWNVQCCWIHDLACHYGKDPKSAFEVGWDAAASQKRRDADKRFWQCNRSAAPSFWGRLRADIRYIGVRIGAFLP